MLLPSIFDDTFATDVFDDMFRTPFGMNNTFTGMKSMNSDIKELDDGYQIDMELPGYGKDDVQAELKDGYMTITAKRAENKDEKDENGKYIRRERYSGSCQRSFYVGDAVIEEDIKAKFKDGILTIQIPKKEQLPQKDEKKFITIEG